MKKVININFQGRVVPIEESAHEILKRYIDSLSNFFANEEGREEIINDIEGRIAELFAETLKKGTTCIADDDVNNIISSIGRPEDFEADELNVKEQLGGNASTGQFYTNQSTKGFSNFTVQTGHRMYRDENSKILGGVCSGVANYFNTDPTIIRILSVIFFAVTFIPYLILWVVVPSSATQQIGSIRKRLFRNPDEKIIAGVCSGLSHYFGINVWIPRLLFVLPFISFVFKMKYFFPFGSLPHFFNFTVSPGAIVIYVILWVILPEALTTADKLEMKGEKIDLNSIKNTIQGDMEGFGKRVNEWGKEMSEKAKNVGEDIKQSSQQWSADMKQKTQNYQAQMNQNIKRSSSGFGNFIITIFKVIAYTIIGIATLAVIIALFSAGVALTGLLPIKDYVIKDGWQNICAWGTLLFFIWIPVIGAITFIIRRLAKAKRNSNAIRYTFSGLWIAGWVFAICFVASIAQDFRYGNTPTEETLPLNNPKVQKLEIKTSSFNKFYHWDWLNIEPFGNFVEDTAFVKNYRVRIIKSNNDSFQLKMVKMARGFSRIEANALADKISFTVMQEDSVLKLAKGIAISKKDKFRNQHVVLTLAVPVGKRFKVNSEVYWSNNTKIQVGWDNDDWNDYHNGFYNDNEAYSYNSDVEYIMTETGLKRVYSKKDNNNEENKDDEENNNTHDKLEKYKNSREELRLQIENEKRKLDEKKRQLEEKEKEYKKGIDSTIKQNTTLNKTDNAQFILGDIMLSKFSG